MLDQTTELLEAFAKGESNDSTLWAAVASALTKAFDNDENGQHAHRALDVRQSLTFPLFISTQVSGRHNASPSCLLLSHTKSRHLHRCSRSPVITLSSLLTSISSLRTRRTSKHSTLNSCTSLVPTISTSSDKLSTRLRKCGRRSETECWDWYPKPRLSWLRRGRRLKVESRRLLGHSSRRLRSTLGRVSMNTWSSRNFSLELAKFEQLLLKVLVCVRVLRCRLILSLPPHPTREVAMVSFERDRRDAKLGVK